MLKDITLGQFFPGTTIVHRLDPRTKLVLLVVLFASFNTQNLIADVFFWLFPVMAVVERVLPGRQTAQET